MFFNIPTFQHQPFLGDIFLLIWTHFGASWLQFGGSLALLASLWAFLGSSWELFGLPWGSPGSSCALDCLNFGASWCQLWKFGPPRPLPISLFS